MEGAFPLDDPPPSDEGLEPHPSGPARAGVADPVALRIFNHSLYELRRGVRALFMMTMSAGDCRAVAAKLAREDVAFHVQPVGARKVNLFFGRAPFVETARHLARKPLSALTPEEDFMLGTLLGYDREQQCRRFLMRRTGGQPAGPGASA